MAAPLDTNDDHPLALELTSLRAALARFQNEAHSSAIKLQHNALNVSHAHERTQHLERENARLQEEIATLRAHPHPAESSQDPTALQTTINQLTIALRSISDKLDLTESTLLTRTTELVNAMGDLGWTKLEVESAYELAARTRAREEEGLVRERELQGRVRAAEEETKMSDWVVMEYADLVRSLEGRPNVHVHPHPQENSSPQSDSASSGSSLSVSNGTTALVDSLTEGKSGLQKLFSEFNTETTYLQSEIDRLTHDLAVSLAKYDAQRKSAERERTELAKAKFELEKLKTDDGTAAKMVSRYMKFSQKTANDLQASLSTLSTRHASTLSTLSFTIQTLQAALSRETQTSKNLRAALDELSADIAREVYGRRREVALRLRLVGRDERLREGVRRLTRRIEEGLSRMVVGDGESGVRQVAERLVGEASGLVNTLDGSEETPCEGALGRIITAESAVAMLTQELQVETEKRMKLERMAARRQSDENRNEQEESGRTVMEQDATIDPRTPLVANDGLLGAVLEAPGGDAAVNGAGNANGASPASPVADSPTSVDVPSDHDNTSSADTATFLDPVDSDLQPVHVNPALNNKYCSVEIALEPTAVDLLHSNQSPAPSGLVVPFTSPPPLESSPVSPNGNGQSYPQDVSRERDLPSITMSSTSNPNVFDSNQAHQADALRRSAVPCLLPNLALTVDTPANSEPSPPCSPVAVDSDSFTNSLDLPSKHPLLAELIHVCHRYDDLQRAFRDSHIALEDLRIHLKSSTSEAFISPATSSMAITAPMLQMALERLNDYTEDARVELEIRTADEALLARGFETLLSVPGALASAADPSFATTFATTLTDEHRHLEQAAVDRDIRAFVDGTDKSVAKAIQSLTKKLDDIQHDIAAIKRALYDPALDSGPDDPFSPSTPSLPDPSSAKWTSWTVGILGSGSRPVSPALTFGSVMTSPRLRHTPSGRSISVDLNAADPFASLGLRVPMPAYAHASPTRPSVRPRTLSAMYMLGLGAGSTGGLLSGVTPGLAGNGREEKMDGDEEADELDSGVE